jgi:heavy metal sensor kinase
VLKGPVSISLRLTVWFGGIFFFGWVVFGLVMWQNLKSTLKADRYQTLARRVDRLQDLLAKSQGESEEYRHQMFKDFAHATGNGLVEIFSSDGNRAYPSPSSAASTFPWPVVNGGEGEQFLHVIAAGQPYWVIARRYFLNGQSLALFAAAPEAGNLVILQNFWRGLLTSVPILLLISSLGGYWMSHRALKPVDRITTAARSISIGNLSHRLPVSESGDELQRLAETCNAMLERLDSAVSQIKRFTADASHELRGPLSFTRTVAEVALRNPNADSESRRAFEDIVEESAKAADLLEGMLTLARADSHSVDTVLESVDLGAVVQEACSLARPLAEKRNLRLSVSTASTSLVKVSGDISSLRRLVWILLDNALKYTPAPGDIEVAAGTVSGRSFVTVRDSGIGIAESDLPYIFDRFYRADPSRSQVEGNGLGLAIAKWIADLHRADFFVDSAQEEGSLFSVIFPLIEQ